MESIEPQFRLSSLWLVKAGRRVISTNRARILIFLIILAELGAGGLAGILDWAGPWWVKISAAALFLGFLLAGVRAILRIRNRELQGINACLSGLADDQIESRVYYDQPDDELGRTGMLLNRLLDRGEERLLKQKRLMGAISHDLRTPLTILRGNMEVALLRPRTAEEYQEILGSNLEEVDRISRLVEDLLTVSKAEAGDLKMAFRPANLGQLLAELASEYRKVSLKRRLDLTSALENDIIIEIDRNRVKQLFANLIENAIQYSPRGGKIELILRRGEKECWAIIRDQGVGIPPEELPYIFEPFYRGTEAKRLSSQGYGLGLSICKQIANAHNGDIEVESRVGPEGGTAFKIRFPL